MPGLLTARYRSGCLLEPVTLSRIVSAWSSTAATNSEPDERSATRRNPSRLAFAPYRVLDRFVAAIGERAVRMGGPP